MTYDCSGNKEALLCFGFDESIYISWTIALVVFFLTLFVLGYRVYLDVREFSTGLIQLNELRPIGNEITNAMWRAVSTGYSFSILLSGLSTDAARMSFFHDYSIREAVTYLLFLSKIPVVIGAIIFIVLTITTSLFRRRLAFPPSTISSRPNVFSPGNLALYLHFTIVYLLTPVDLGLLKLLPWRGTDFTFSYMGYPSASTLYLSVFSSLLSITAQFISAMVIIPYGISGVSSRTKTYYLPITNSLLFDEILYWLYIIFTVMQFIACAVYAGMIIHQTITGRLGRLESKTQDTSTFQRLATSEDQAVDSIHGGNDHDVEIEFGTRNPVQFAVSGGNLNKRSSFH